MTLLTPLLVLLSLGLAAGGKSKKEPSYSLLELSDVEQVQAIAGGSIPRVKQIQSERVHCCDGLFSVEWRNDAAGASRWADSLQLLPRDG